MEKKENLIIPMPKREKEKISDAAKKRGITMSMLARLAIKKYIKEEESNDRAGVQTTSGD